MKSGILKLLGLVALLSCLHGFGGCAQPTPPAATVAGSLTGSPIDPGGAIQVTYSITYNGPWGDIRSVTLRGLPPNSPSNNNLPVPSGSGAQQSANITVNVPARDGDWALSVEVDYSATFAASAGIGTLRVNNMPATLGNVTLVPSSHRTGQCGNPLPAAITLTLTYTVTDNNGANDLYLPRITSIAPVTEVLTVSAAPAPLFLSPPTLDGSVQEVVSTSIDVRCDVRAPHTWTWSIEARDDDTPAGTTLTVIGTPTPTYSTTP